MPKHKSLALLLALAAAAPAAAQYVPPSPAAPTPGLIDDYLKTEPALSGWDFIINDRARYEDKSDAGTTHAGSNFDFFSASPTDNSNSYWLTRLMPKLSYTDGLISFVVEGRSSYSVWRQPLHRRRRPARTWPKTTAPFSCRWPTLLSGT